MDECVNERHCKYLYKMCSLYMKHNENKLNLSVRNLDQYCYNVSLVTPFNDVTVKPADVLAIIVFVIVIGR